MEKGSFQNVHFLDILEKLDVLEILKKQLSGGKQRRVRRLHLKRDFLIGVPKSVLSVSLKCPNNSVVIVFCLTTSCYSETLPLEIAASLAQIQRKRKLRAKKGEGFSRTQPTRTPFTSPILLYWAFRQAKKKELIK